MEETLILADLCAVTKFYSNQRCSDTMHILEHAVATNTPLDLHYSPPNYRCLLVDCASLSIDLHSEILAIQRFIAGRLRLSFPMFECMVTDPVLYAHVVKDFGNDTAHVVKDFGNDTDLSTVHDRGPTPSEEAMKSIVDGCDRIVAISSLRKKLVGFVESRIGHVAPNLAAYVGAAVAAKLVAGAGGLEELMSVPVPEIPFLGKSNENGSSCYLHEAEPYQRAPIRCRTNVGLTLAQNCSMLARIDFQGSDPAGERGRTMAEQARRMSVYWEAQSAEFEMIRPSRRIGVAKAHALLKERHYRSSNAGSGRRRGAIPKSRTTVSSLALALEGIRLADLEGKANGT